MYEAENGIEQSLRKSTFGQTMNDTFHQDENFIVAVVNITIAHLQNQNN